MPVPQDEGVCVYCRKRPVDPDWRPFCSKRCKTLDLAHWADGTYRVADEPAGEPETETSDG